MAIKLTKPIKVKGKEISEIELNFDKLTGSDLVAAETEARAMGETAPVIAASMRYQAAVAARILGCPADDILSMPAADFKTITTQVMSFLFA